MRFFVSQSNVNCPLVGCDLKVKIPTAVFTADQRKQTAFGNSQLCDRTVRDVGMCGETIFFGDAQF